MKCAECGFDLSRFDTECPQCRTRKAPPQDAATRASDGAAALVQKECPVCGRLEPTSAPICAQCGHLFRTQFATQEPFAQPDPPRMADSVPYSPPPAQPPYSQSVYPPPPYYPPPNGFAPGYSPYYQQMPGTIQKIPGTHSVGLAVLFHFLLTGGGQMFNGQVAKGFMLLGVAIVLAFVTLGIGTVVIWIIALIDAVSIGNKLNQGQPVGAWEFF
jgi:TM2 domain-containing membrane protein YozV